MRSRYCCAISLEGYIAGPGDEFDWIVMDPEIDFAELSAQFDTWLFGGGSLFRSLAAEGFVDTVQVAVMPTILGGGIPLIAEPTDRIPLALIARRTYEKTGTVMLVYAVKTSRGERQPPDDRPAKTPGYVPDHPPHRQLPPERGSGHRRPAAQAGGRRGAASRGPAPQRAGLLAGHGLAGRRGAGSAVRAHRHRAADSRHGARDPRRRRAHRRLQRARRRRQGGGGRNRRGSRVDRGQRGCRTPRRRCCSRSARTWATSAPRRSTLLPCAPAWRSCRTSTGRWAASSWPVRGRTRCASPSTGAPRTPARSRRPDAARCRWRRARFSACSSAASTATPSPTRGCSPAARQRTSSRRKHR